MKLQFGQEITQGNAEKCAGGKGECCGKHAAGLQLRGLIGRRLGETDLEQNHT
jgi:hypothetical protein